MAYKNAELQHLTDIYKNILKDAGVSMIEGHGKVGYCYVSRLMIIIILLNQTSLMLFMFL